MNTLLAVFLGGGLGSLARYFISVYAYRLSSNFPLGTLISNLLACFCLAFFMVLLKDKMMAQPVWRLFLITGFCGGFSTFSTFSYENFALLRNDHLYLMLMNVLISVVTGIGIIYFLMKDMHIHE